MNYAYQTIAHNTITVRDPKDTIAAPPKARKKDKDKDEKPRQFANDGGQRRVGSGWGIESAPLDLQEWQRKREIYHTGKIEKHLIRDGLIVAVSDITPAYTNAYSGQETFSHRTRRVERLWRTFGYDAVDDVVVIFDQLRTTDPEFRKRWLLHTIEFPDSTDRSFSISNMSAGGTGHPGGRLEGHVLLPKTSHIRVIGGSKAAFLADGKNYDEDGTLVKKSLKRSNLEPGAWRIEISPGDDSADALFLIVMLPSSLSSAPVHQIRLLKETGRVGCEIIGPQRTTRWWFSPGRNGVDIEVISRNGKHSRYPL
jgi:hypothetical protein